MHSTKMCNICLLLLYYLKTIRLVQKNISFGHRISFILFSTMFVRKVFCSDKYLASCKWEIYAHMWVGVCIKWSLKQLGLNETWNDSTFLLWNSEVSNLDNHFIHSWVVSCIQDGWTTKVEKFWTDDFCWLLSLGHTSLNFCCLCRHAEAWWGGDR